MRRQIKFRAKAMHNNKWVYGYYTEYTCPEYGSKDYEIHAADDIHDVYSETLGQITGLKGINSDDIYEGDIISNGDYRYIVRYNNASGGFVGDGLNHECDCSPVYQEWINFCGFSVIGNIHEAK